MESTTIEPSEKNETDRPEHQRLGVVAPKTMRALLGVEGISFLLASVIHTGTIIQGYAHREAMIAEGVIGAVLLVGLVMTRFRPRSIFSIAVVVQSFALVVTLIGAWTIFIGVGPQTIPDIVYHVIILVVLVTGLGLAWRARRTESTQ